MANIEEIEERQLIPHVRDDIGPYFVSGLNEFASHRAVAEVRAVSEAERFMAIPGQALAYKIGQLKIWDIRHNAEAALGEKFSVKDFHTEILKDGAMPLSILESKMDRWVESQL